MSSSFEMRQRKLPTGMLKSSSIDVAECFIKDNDRKRPGMDADFLEDYERKKLLDFDSIHGAMKDDVQIITNYDKEKNEEQNGENGKKEKKKKDDFNQAPKMNTLVGFLRLANYVCAVTVIFGLIISLLYPPLPDEPEPRGYLLWQDVVFFASGWIQIIYLAVVSVLVMIDSVATFTFRWKEYGELTYTQADATSIIFFLTPSRWLWRLGAGLMMATSISLRTTRIIRLEEFAPHDHNWYFGLALSGVGSSLVGFIFSLSPWHGVHWLYDSFNMKHVEDKGDVWTSNTSWYSASYSSSASSSSSSSSESTLAPLKNKNPKMNDTLNHYQQPRFQEPHRQQSVMSRTLGWCGLTVRTAMVILSKLSVLVVLIISFVFHCVALSITLSDSTIEKTEYWITVASFICCQALNVMIMVYLVVKMFMKCSLTTRVPGLIKLLTPYVLSSAIRSFLEIRFDDEDEVLAMKTTATYTWMFAMVILIFIFLLELSLRLWPSHKYMSRFFDFVCQNIREDGVNKKTIRFLDTIGSLAGLIALVLGLISIFIDQYDLIFVPEGFAKDVTDAIDTFQKTIKPVTATLSKMIEILDKEFTCKDVYTTLGTAGAVTLFTSFFPGASSVATIGSRGAYYGVRTANALTNLASKLRRSKNIIWQFARALYVLQKFALGSMKTILKTSNFATLVKLLPFFPPVVIGIHVLFAAFWPQRILFFSAKQRRKTIGGILYKRMLGITVLVVAISINTALIDEIVRFMDENIPFAGVSVERKMGWHISTVAFGFAFLSLACFLIAAFILKFQTHKDHQNLTNAETEWKEELEKRELVAIKTGIGDKIEKRTQIRYKKERIGPWTWVLPILLCSISCGFGVLANLNPKLEFQLEPKGSFGRVIENAHRRLYDYERDMYDVKNDTDLECLPYASFNDLWQEKHYSNILKNPVNKFFNETEKLIKPVRDVLNGLRKQMMLDIQDELFGDEINNIWNENNLQYLGMILLIPRAICLLILIFGMFTASIWVCMMRIIQSIDPKSLVDAYGKVALFSVIYVLGSQLALYNLISAFGVPFFHITIRFGLGFIYDLVADFILVSVYIGMKNEFFFAIPKRKVMVTYSVPGVSDTGPNVPGQII